MFRRPPKWVKTYPIEIDRITLTRLARASKGSFDKPREMNFCIYKIKPIQEFEEIQKNIQKAGWMCQVSEDPADPGKLALTATKYDYCITESNYTRDSIFFRRLAEMYGASYDGWFASSSNKTKHPNEYDSSRQALEQANEMLRLDSLPTFDENFLNRLYDSYRTIFRVYASKFASSSTEVVRNALMLEMVDAFSLVHLQIKLGTISLPADLGELMEDYDHAPDEYPGYEQRKDKLIQKSYLILKEASLAKADRSTLEPITNLPRIAGKFRATGLREVLASTGKAPFHRIDDFAAAKVDPKSYAVMEGDYGGQVYLTVPMSEVACTEEQLMELLGQLDKISWDDIEGATLYYEKLSPGQPVPGGMGGGMAESRLWLHSSLKHLRSDIESYLTGETSLTQLSMKLREHKGD